MEYQRKRAAKQLSLGVAYRGVEMGEVDTLINLLETSRVSFDHSVTGLMPAQWTFKPAPDRWSIFEVTEHIASVETGTCRLMSGRLFSRPATEQQKAETQGKDEQIVARLRDRSRPMEAPELVRPTGRWPSPAGAIETFQETREQMIALLRSVPHNLRDYCAPHPLMGTLDGYQWVVFVVAHLDRHIVQVDEIKRTPGFP